VKADAPFPKGTSENEWQLTRSREANDVDAEVREAVDQRLFTISDRAFAVGDSRVANVRMRVCAHIPGNFHYERRKPRTKKIGSEKWD